MSFFIINVIEIASTTCPIRTSLVLSEMKNTDFSLPQIIGNAVVDGVEYPITTTISQGILTLSCEKSVTLQVFYGKDNYV